MTARLSVLLLFLAVGAGCDRAGIEPLQPQLTIESPDLSEILAGPELTLRVRAAGSGRIASLRIGERLATRSGDSFSATLNVTRGLNAIPLVALDADGEQVLADTAYALFINPVTELQTPPTGLEGGGGLSLTSLDVDRLLMAGGEPPAGDAKAPATLLRASGELLFVENEAELLTARYNHSATLLPDGSVLLLGGATRRVPRSPDEFVATAEIITPGRSTSERVLFLGDGTPPRRSGHVTRLVEADGEILLFLVGGLVPGTPPSPSQTVDVLRYVPGGVPRLAVLTPPGGAGDLPELPDPVLLDLTSSPDGNALSLLYGLGPSDDVASRLTWMPPGPPSYPVGLSTSEAPGLLGGRTRAASAALPGGLFLVSGGQDDAGATLASVEAVAPAAGQSFTLPTAGSLIRPRSGHAATSLGPGRMIVIGGYNEAGFPILEPEIITL